MKQLFSILLCLQLLLLPVSVAEAKKEGGGSTTNQILALGTGIIGSNIITSCTMGTVTPSIMAFGAGSLVYIGSEIFGAKAQKAFIDAKSEDIKQLKATMTEGGDLQRGIIEARLEEEKEKQSFVKKRKKWMTAVTAIYTTATAFAVMELICTSNPLTISGCSHWVSAACNGAMCLPPATLLTKALAVAYGFGTSMAGGGAISSYGSMLYGGLTLLMPTLSTKVSVAYQFPKARIATFGAGTALSLMVVKELNGIEKELDENIKDLESVLANLKEKTEDPNGLKDGAGSVDLAKDNINLMQGSGNVKRMAVGDDLNKHCWGKNSEGTQTYSSDVCNNSLKLSRPKYNSKFNLPTLQSVANTGTDMAQAVANGDMAAANLASNAMRVKQIKDNLLKQLNEQNKKLGKEPYDYEKEVNNTLASMRDSLNKGGAGQAGNLAGFGSGVPSSSLDAKPSDEAYQEIKTSGSDEAIAADAGQADGVQFDINEGSGESDTFDLGDAALAEAHSLEDFETQESDILAKPEESIFKQLSNRYLLNYNRIFDTKPATPAEAK